MSACQHILSPVGKKAWEIKLRTGGSPKYIKLEESELDAFNEEIVIQLLLHNVLSPAYNYMCLSKRAEYYF